MPKPPPNDIAFEDPSGNPKGLVEKQHLKGIITDQGGNVLAAKTAGWGRIKKLTRMHLMELSGFTPGGKGAHSQEVEDLTFTDIEDIGQVLAKFNGMDYPGNVHSCCTCV